MNKLDMLVCLKDKAAIYVPSTINEGTKTTHIDNADFVRDVAAKMADMFGGASAYNVTGYWTSPLRGLESENTTVVYSSCDNVGPYVDALVDICEKLKADMGQDAVSLEINGKFYLV